MVELFFLGLVLNALVFAPLGMVLGVFLKGRPTWGALAGMGLGPLGVLLVVCMKDDRRHCPACKGAIPQGATRCKHCSEKIQEPQCPECQVDLLPSRKGGRCPACDSLFSQVVL